MIEEIVKSLYYYTTQQTLKECQKGFVNHLCSSMKFSSLMLCFFVIFSLHTCITERSPNDYEEELTIGHRSIHTKSGERYTQNGSVLQKCSGDSSPVLHETDDSLCPYTWFVEKNGTCVCGSSLEGVVQCDVATKEVRILDCHCMTLAQHNGQWVAVVGSCFFNCMNISNSYTDLIYHRVPKYFSDLNETCNYLNRIGTLCGECMSGYVLAAYSYSMDCIKYPHTHHNWLKYLAVTFLPLTGFIIIIIIFRISVVSPTLNALVFLTQFTSIPTNIRVFLYGVKHLSSKLPVRAVKTFAMMDGIWNLDFFRTLVPDIYLNITPLQWLALDYLVAVYPMLMMAIAYVLVELHGYGFRPVLYMWRPFHCFFARFRRQWDIQHSIMDTFVTFLLLSVMKLLSTSVGLLLPTRLYNATGHSLGLYLYYDPNLAFFKDKHAPYGLLAVVVLILFVALPLILLFLYPLKCFRICLVKFGLNFRVVDDFVHIFQQYYKDGHNGTADCRWFSGFYILLRFLVNICYAICLNGLVYILVTAIFICAAIVVIIFEPYKQEFSQFNCIDAIFMLYVAMWCGTLSFLNISAMFQRTYDLSLMVLFGCINVLHNIILAGVLLWWLYRRCNLKIHLRLMKKVGYGQRELSSDILPHRLLNSDQYRDSGFGYVREN